MKKQQVSDFEKAAAVQPRGSFVGDLWGFIKTNKKWWLMPIIIVLIAFGVLILLSSTGVAPFIYTLF